MKRIKSIDTFRGGSIIVMVFGHFLLFWLRPEDAWLQFWLWAFLKPLGASGFLFVSGISASLSFRNYQNTVKDSDTVSMKTVRNVYILRATFILIIAFIFNTFSAMVWGGSIWEWNALQTIGFSLLLAWPLLKTSKLFRIFLGIAMIIGNQLIFDLLSSYKGEASLYGILYHILFFPLDQYVIMNFFGIFIIGSAIGEFIYNINIIEGQNKRKYQFKNKLLKQMLLIGISLVVFIVIYQLIGIFLVVLGVIYQFPSILMFNSIPSIIFALGLILTILSILMLIEVLEKVKTTKSYTYFFYYSYYSFTLYLLHNPLALLFLQQFNYITIWLVIAVGLVIFGLILRLTYKKLGKYASLKAVLSIISFLIATRLIENRSKKSA
ncbi:MAG: heparan-alpha-glucosaminide N-acetyltransferase domain-containing protein [Promethearchaeota archaeon]